MKLFTLVRNLDIIETNIDFTDERENVEITNISIDSRETGEADLFICLVGTKDDGHRHIGAAIERGAAAVILEYKPVSLDADTKYMRVLSARTAESILWSEWHGNPAEGIKLIGITGTNGKTSVAYMIKKILDDAGFTTALFGTIQYIICGEEHESSMTTYDPKELFALLREARDKGCEYVVMEISSHSLALDKLAGLGKILLGVFTNLTQDHLDFHINMKNYMKAKAKLFTMCKIGILNADDEVSGVIAETSASVNYFYSVKGKADFYARDILYSGTDGLQYKLILQCETDGDSIKETTANIKSPMAGGFYVYNTLAAAAAGTLLGVDTHLIERAISEVIIRGRMERLRIDTPYSVFIDYAHTPDALVNVLRSIRSFSSGNIFAVFGCGGDRDKSKRAVMGKIASENADFVIITSDNPRSEIPEAIISDIAAGIDKTMCKEFKFTGENSVDKFPQFITIPDREKAIAFALGAATPGDVILLAGKGHETYIRDKSGERHFDEREIVARLLQ
ncbi:UDP-N-acetylmuramoyl-L-alanyl-D-glutamate--2,6-diaminopimelate ligase [Clostridia bacterium]|nr:UDP-N-acetylmuramoyl-L-alanyl-D-glutamate--2,6-diaminopimelate ligase [Clostridia bacterium]